MLDVTGFDRWADEYEQSVRGSEAADSYPFAEVTHLIIAALLMLRLYRMKIKPMEPAER